MDWKLLQKIQGEAVIPECDFCERQATELTYESDGTPSPRCYYHKDLP
ncbi:MAG: hypothetical protein KDH96_05935 [Candidatus Riesia sp.]|nr:hypothetical protein [Candidatus Riesia sp.]